MNKDGNVVFPKGIVNFQAASSKGGQGKVSSKIYNNNLKRSGAAKTILLKKKIVKVRKSIHLNLLMIIK